MLDVDQEGIGLSPRVRGSPVPVTAPSVTDGSIPACAGEPVIASHNAQAAPVYPRVCGGAR